MNDESRTKSCFAADRGAAVVERMCWNAVAGEAVKARRVARKLGRRVAMAAGVEEVSAEAGEAEVMLWGFCGGGRRWWGWVGLMWSRAGWG